MIVILYFWACIIILPHSIVVSPTGSRYSVTLRKANFGKFGFQNFGNKITGMTIGGSADKNGEIRVGDKICSINQIEASDTTSTEKVSSMLRNSGTSVSLILKRGKI